MKDYSKTKMYMLKHKEDVDNRNIYIGYNTDWNRRLIAHKCKYNSGSDYLVYQYMRANGGWDEWVMDLIEEYPCEDAKEAMFRERELMILYNSTLNKNRNIILNDEEKKEYMKNYKRDKEKKAISDKAYKQTEKCKEMRKIKITCECGFIGLKENIQRHRKSKKHLDLMEL